MHSTQAAREKPLQVGVGWHIVDGLISLRRSRVGQALGKHKSILLVLPAVALVCVLAAGIGILAWGSIHEYDTFLAVPGDLSLTQYSQVISDEQFQTDLVRTLVMGSLTALIAVGLAIPFSLVMARTASRLARLALMVALFVPYLTGDITRTFGWLSVLGPRGPLAWLFEQFGVQFPHLVGGLWAIGLGTVQVLIPAAVVILLPAVLRLDPELEHAASTLGARRYRAFVHVTLPQLRFSAFGALAACWALSVGDFADPQILGQGIKDYLANFLQNRYLAIGNPAQGAATGVILIVIVTVGAGLIVVLGRLRWRRRVL
jgi:putative spermidine/putrescine transport system permease protein